MKIQSKEEILMEALDIIAFEGIDRLSLSTLASRLGVNKSSLYHWFGSKEEILDEAFRHGHRLLMAKGFRLELNSSALMTAAKAWQDIFTDEGILPYLRTVFSLRFSNPQAAEEARAIKLMIKSQIEVILNGAGLISELFSALLIEKLLSELDGEHEDIEELAEKYMRFLSEKSPRPKA